MPDLKQKRTFNGHTFELDTDSCYECRGGMYHDDEHDQVPEPSLQKAADQLQASLKSEGISSEIEFGEKGWIEVHIED